MADVTTFVDGVQTVEHIGTKIAMAENILDFSKTPVSANDVVDALTIPKGAVLLEVGLRVIIGETGTLNIGDSDDADGFFAVQSMATAGLFLSDGVLAGNKAYADEDMIEVIPSADLDSGKISIFAIYGILESINPG